MNLLDKNWLALSLGMTLAIFSCEDSSEIGNGLDSDAVDAQIIYHEMTLSAGNVFIDSLMTSNTPLLWAGKNSSEIYGSTQSDIYCQLYTGSSLRGLVNTYDTISESPLQLDTLKKQYYVIDTAILNLQVVALNSLNAEGSQTFTLHEIDDELFSSVYYLANKVTPILENDPEDEFSFEFDLTRLKKVFEKASTDTSTYIVKHRLSEHLYNRLVDVVKKNGSTLGLRKVFKGLAIVAGEENTALIGINPAGRTNITINYHIESVDKEGTVEVVTKDLVMTYLFSGSARYNKISTQRDGSLIGDQNPTTYQPFDTQDDKVYFHPASGVYPTISLQKVYDFIDSLHALDEAPYVQIIRAEFDFNTTKNTGYHNNNLADFRMLFLDNKNRINTTGLYTNSDPYKTLVLNDVGYLNFTQSAMSAPYIFDEESAKPPTYNGVATYFVTLLENEVITAENLVLMPSNMNTMNQTVFKKEDIKIKLYYSLSR